MLTLFLHMRTEKPKCFGAYSLRKLLKHPKTGPFNKMYML